jgi:hypothetical protein
MAAKVEKIGGQTGLNKWKILMVGEDTCHGEGVDGA